MRLFRRFLARIGYISLGAVYAALGVFATTIAVAGSRDRVRGFRGAFRFLLSHPYGPAVVAAMAAGLAAFTLARLIDAADGKRSFFARVGSFIDAIGHAALAWVAVAILLRLRRGASARPALTWLLAQTWGPAVLKVAGVVVLAIGAFQIWQGLSGRLVQKPARHQIGAAAPVAIRVGRFGYVARGVVSAIVGWFLVRTADAIDPRNYHDIGAALGVLESQRFGPFLLALAGVGLVAYGAYLALLGVFRGRSQ